MGASQLCFQARLHDVPLAQPVLHSVIANTRECTPSVPNKGFRKFCITWATVSVVRDKLQVRLQLHEATRRQNLRTAFRAAGIPIPDPLLETQHIGPGVPAFDRTLVRGISQLIEIRELSLETTVALWHNESESDPRPNKALDPEWLDILLHGYAYRINVVNVANFGVRHSLQSPRPTDSCPVQNHKSARRYPKALLRSVGEGQVAGTYLVNKMDTALAWSKLRLSPFGCVPKKNVPPEVEARLIHDLSWPAGESTNACTVQANLPELVFSPVHNLAARLEDLAAKIPGEAIRMLKGDVKWAFRNIPVAALLTAHFAGSCSPDEAVIDLALPFGWTGPPAHYGEFGETISFLVSRESPNSLDPADPDMEPFFSYVWVDDHVVVEVDRGNRWRWQNVL